MKKQDIKGSMGELRSIKGNFQLLYQRIKQVERENLLSFAFFSSEEMGKVLDKLDTEISWLEERIHKD